MHESFGSGNAIDPMVLIFFGIFTSISSREQMISVPQFLLMISDFPMINILSIFKYSTFHDSTSTCFNFAVPLHHPSFSSAVLAGIVILAKFDLDRLLFIVLNLHQIQLILGMHLKYLSQCILLIHA